MPIGLLFVAAVFVISWVLVRLSHRLRTGHKPAPEPNGDFTGVQVQLTSRNSMTESYDHFFIAMAIVGLAVTGTLYIIGRMTQETAIFMGVFWVVFPLVGAWGMRFEFRGVAELDVDGLTVRVGSKTLFFRWQNVAEMRVTNWADTRGLDGFLARISRTDLHEPYVQLRLSRALRMNDLFSRYSTEGIGLPLNKTYRIYVEKPATFVKRATPYLGEAATAQPVHSQ